MKNKISKILCVMLMTTLLAGCSGNANQNNTAQNDTTQNSQTLASNDEGDSSKTVASIDVGQMPDKTTYVVGETFSAEGGTLMVTYSDGTSSEVSMTDPAVTLSSPTMNTVNTKNVTASYEGEKTVFKIDVVGAMCNFTFDQNYDGAPAAETVQVSQGEPAQEPAVPTRDGYTFVGWYADADYTALFDFATSVNEDTTVYALWTRDGATYVDVTFDYDYYGVILNQYSYPVESGTAVAEPAATPVRTGYTFDKWVDENGNDYDFAQPVTDSITIKAVWTKANDDAQTYVFEAEDTDLTGKIGPSYSGTAQEESMIIYNDSIGASNDRVVGYLYENGNSLEFYIASDSDVSDATIAVSITGEYTTMSYDGNEFQVLVNDNPKDYSRVTIDISSEDSVAPCEDRIVISNVTLNEGANLIQLKTNNTNAVSGTTFKANAPIVDCIKITTSAVLTWDENYGLPVQDNYQH